MRILVIGGTHFVGRHIVELLVECGHQVTVLNRGRSPDCLDPSVERLRADRTRPDELLAALRGRSFESVVDCIAYRKEEVQAVLDAFHGSLRRYVFISSVSVYRPTGLVPIDESHPVQRGSGWEYPRGKVECEDLLETAGHESGFPWVSLRPAYVYGRYNSNPSAEPRFFARVEQGRSVVIPGDGDFVFHQTHARDLACAALAAIQREEAPGGIYNIAGATAQTATRFVQAVGEAMGREVEVAYAPHIRRRREAAPFFFYQTRPPQVYSIQRARRDLAWEPRLDLVAGLRDAYQWFRESDYLAGHSFDFSADDAILADLDGGTAP